MDNKVVKQGNALISILIIITVICLFLSGFCTNQRLNKDYKTIDEMFEGGTIMYNGKYYEQKGNMSTHILLGLDDDGGQCDSIFVLAVDHSARSMYLLPINRNIMAVTDWYKDDNYYGRHLFQLCLAHSLAPKGKENETAASTISNLLFNLPVDSVTSLKEEGISTLGDIIGDVDMVYNETVVQESGNVLSVEGESVTVNSKNLHMFLTFREIEGLGGPQKRLERETEYILAIYNKLKSADTVFRLFKGLFAGKSDTDEQVSSDHESSSSSPAENKDAPLTIDSLKDGYTELSQYIETDIEDPIGLATQLLTYKFDEDHVYWLPHSTTIDKNDVYEECYLDKNAAKETILNLYYKEVLY